jgi:hypothetical protein
LKQELDSNSNSNSNDTDTDTDISKLNPPPQNPASHLLMAPAENDLCPCILLAQRAAVHSRTTGRTASASAPSAQAPAE